MVTKVQANVLEAATQLLYDGGEGGLRIDAVAQAAGANKRMIYHYFRNKEGLVESVIDAQLDHLVRHGRFDEAVCSLLESLSTASPSPDPGAETSVRPNRFALHRASVIVLPLLSKLAFHQTNSPPATSRPESATDISRTTADRLWSTQPEGDDSTISEKSVALESATDILGTTGKWAEGLQNEPLARDTKIWHVLLRGLGDLVVGLQTEESGSERLLTSAAVSPSPKPRYRLRSVSQARPRD